MSGTRRTLLLITSTALAACASVPADRGAARVSALAEARGVTVSAPDADARATRVAGLTATPLDAERAVTLALLNAPALDRVWGELGIAASAAYASGRLANPTLEASRLGVPGGHEFKLSIAQQVTDLLLLPWRVRAAKAGFAAAELHAADAIARHAATTEAAFWHLAGAELHAAALTRSADSAASGAELAERMHAAGNLARGRLAALQAEAVEAELAADTARLTVAERRTALAALIGVPADQDWRIAARLPPAVVVEDEEELVARALDARLDLAAARAAVDAHYAARGQARGFRWLGEVTVGVERERDPGGVKRGPTLELELPLWSRRTDAVLAADGELALAIADAAALQQAVSDGVRLAHRRAVTAARAARLTGGELLPSRATVVTETQARVNFMLDGPFELIEAKRAEYAAWSAWAMARAEYWAARAALAREVGGRLAGPDADAAWLDATSLIPDAADPHAGH
jgi:cobalt-zinc-cadmium efflux system outer membrane protein